MNTECVFKGPLPFPAMISSELAEKELTIICDSQVENVETLLR